MKVARPLHRIGFFLLVSSRGNGHRKANETLLRYKPEDNICSSGQFKDGVIWLLLLHIKSKAA